MCGIAGFIGPESEKVLVRMTDALRRRGPDDEGHVEAVAGGRPIRLGFRRLAIIDLAGGRQPMATEDDETVIVFNGEIYNAPELRRELEGLGRRFVTDHSDTEVILQGFCVWGEEILARLNGMYAFCLLDKRAGRLFFARDRMGKKPLYYADTRDGLAFGSEIGSLLAHPGVDATIDQTSVAKFFAYGYVPAPATLYRNIFKLPAAHAMQVDIATGEKRIYRYWRYAPGEDSPPPGGPDDWAAELRERLTSAVARRLVSDVPLGFFLSGGVDSTAVAALAARMVDPASMRTFTIGFTEESYDESPFAAAAAESIGTTHRCDVLEFDRAVDLIPGLLRQIDDPIADPSILPTWLLSDFTRRSVTVALSGDGADELFAGYDTFAALSMARRYHRWTPRFLHRTFESSARLLPRSGKNMSFDFKLRRALRGLGLPPSQWAPAWLGPAGPEETARATGAATDAIYQEAEDLWFERPNADLVDQSLAFYARFYLQDDILTKVDRASMLCSLEVRSPFLDREVVEFAMRLPADVKLRNGQRKWILKQALKGIVPETVLHRKKKGFGIPLADWLRRLPPPPAAATERLGLDGAWLQARWREHRSGQADHRGLLWAWTALAYAVEGATAGRGE
jgi:asparagine synthase (glutamine-hydrolysing)